MKREYGERQIKIFIVYKHRVSTSAFSSSYFPYNRSVCKTGFSLRKKSKFIFNNNKILSTVNRIRNLFKTFLKKRRIYSP